MGLFSSFQRKPEPRRQQRAAVPQDAAAVELLRVRARRRLIGAAVLVVLAVITLPMIFESTPRPLDTSIAIVLPSKEAAAPVGGLAASSVGGADVAPMSLPNGRVEVPAVRAPAPTRPKDAAALPVPVKPAASAPVTPAPDTARADQVRADRLKAEKERAERDKAERLKADKDKAERSAKQAVEKAAADRAAAERAAGERERLVAAAKAAAEKAADKAAAEKALAGKVAEPPGRYLVQVGAFAEPATVRATVQRIEQLGLRASEQEVDTAAGRRTRVRLGPYASREDAERALVRLRAAGLPGVVLAP